MTVLMITLKISKEMETGIKNKLFINKNKIQMADNFNLRQFLSENKLTKNARLLKEQEMGHYRVGVSFTDKPGIQYGYQIDAEDKQDVERVLAARLAEKEPGRDYKISMLIGPLQTSEPTEELSSKVEHSSIEIDGVDSKDYPDFVDAFITYAEFTDGTPLNDNELDQLTDEYRDTGELGELAAESLY